MGYVEWNCPKCQKLNREGCNAWVYGSPIRYCKACNAEFFDNRWRELAINGVEPASKNPKFYLGATIVSILFTCVCALWLISDIKIRGSYPIRLLGCVILGIISSIACLLVFLRIVTGYEDKQNVKYYNESVQRLQNKEYVDKLISYGCNVPDIYR